MKKLLLLLLVVPLFISCGSGDEEKDGNNLEFIQVRVTSDSNATPNGNVYLFKVNGYDLVSDKPNSTSMEYDPFLSYKYNNETRYMSAISATGSKSKGDLIISEKYGSSVGSIFWDDLSSLYGVPKSGDEYILLVVLRTGKYERAYKRLTITKNSTISVHIPSSDDYSKYVDATWNISDYTEN